MILRVGFKAWLGHYVECLGKTIKFLHCVSSPMSINRYCPSLPGSINGYCPSPPRSISGYCPSPPQSMNGCYPSPPKSIIRYCPSPPRSIIRYCPSPPKGMNGYCPSPPRSINKYCSSPPSHRLFEGGIALSSGLIFIRWIVQYVFVVTYLLDSNLSVCWHFLTFIKLSPGV